MESLSFSSSLLIMTCLMFYLGRSRALQVAKGDPGALHSLPAYHGFYTALWCAIPAVLVALAWFALESTVIDKVIIADLPAETRSLPGEKLELILNEIRNIANGSMPSQQADLSIRSAASHYLSLKTVSNWALVVLDLALCMLASVIAVRGIRADLRARNRVETVVRGFLMLCSSIAILTTIGIVLSVLFEALRFFQKVPPTEFLLGIKWSPQTAIRSDQVGGSGSFGAVPLFTGTMLISTIAMAVAVPIGLMSAIYLSEYAAPRFRTIAKPVLEVLAGIPTVVYGFFAALVVAPLIRDAGAHLGFDVSSESALAAGLVMGVMIIPFVSSLADDVINAVPQSLRDGAYGLGATRSETIRQVVLPAALPGIVGGVLLAVSRAIGETMIVVMAAGLSANFTANPLQAVTTVTVQIVTLLVGDQEFDSPKTLAAFALGLVLFIVTLVLNIIALHVVKKYREQYE